MLIPRSANAIMPWKNGRGSTREIARHPLEEPWAWRVSVATLEGVSVFSRFDDVRRIFMPLDGVVDLQLDGVARRVEPFDTATFSGSTSVVAAVSASTRAFNLMWRSGSADLEIAAEGVATLLHAVATACVVTAERRFELSPGDTLVFEDGAARFTATSPLVAVRIVTAEA